VIKSKTLKMRIIYIVAAVAMLAMLIPAMAVPVSAADTLTMVLWDPITNQPWQTSDSQYDITGSIVQVTASSAPTNWWIQPVAPPANATAQFVFPNAHPTTETVVRVQGTYGEVIIWATINGHDVSIDKKFGQIESTDITPPQNVPVTWNESVKEFQGSATIEDSVNGVFVDKDGGLHYHAMQGTILNWYLIAGWEDVSLTPAEAPILNDEMDQLCDAFFVEFGSMDNPMGTYIQTVTDANGESSVNIFADGEENVKVVVVPQYPGPIQLDVTPEITSVNFWTREMEVVPQVRWAGEKIVLEKNFFTGPAPIETEDGFIFFVRFTLTGNSKGSLEAIGPLPPLGVNDGQTVDCVIDENGFASVILYSPVQGDIDVTATLYVWVPGGRGIEKWDINQHHFVVYYLKLGELSLGNVYGKRAFHDDGPWIPNNPWDPEGTYNDPATPDVLVETLNVSQDALLRARVNGWFKDAEGDTWTLPDDWAELASPNWVITNIHWDIMNNPSDFNPTVGAEAMAGVPVTSNNPFGSYQQPWPVGQTVAAYPVIGPFSPGIEQPAAAGMPYGYRVPNIRLDMDRQIQTVVPDGELNWWDAPMPPAKITYMITNPSVTVTTDNAGFFKETDKADIYYGYWDDPATTVNEMTVVFTNPFYAINVPAHWAIPAFGNNLGYDWDTFGNSSSHEEYGPYPFWTILNRQTENPIVPTTDAANYPTLAQVYSDNHGEAMIYLNGNWNLDLVTSVEFPGNTNKTSGGAFDIKPGTIVGFSTVQAMADYPYTRQPSASYKAILSNTVTKNWEWGKTIMGADPTTYPDGQVDPGFAAGDEANSKRMVLEVGTLNLQQYTDPPTNSIPNADYLKSSTGEKMAFVWVTDRDGNPTVGEKVDWEVQSATTIRISNKTGVGVSNYNSIMGILGTTDGFLTGTNGTTSDGRTLGTSYMIGIHPTPGPDWANQDNALAAIFYKFYNITRDPNGPQPTDYAVAAVILTSSLEEDANLHATMNEIEGQISREWNLNWGEIDDPDDPLMLGDANYDGKVNMGDVILAERMMLGLNPVLTGADINRDGNVNIADIIAMERYMLGY